MSRQQNRRRQCEDTAYATSADPAVLAAGQTTFLPHPAVYWQARLAIQQGVIRSHKWKAVRLAYGHWHDVWGKLETVTEHFDCLMHLKQASNDVSA